jgi:hypothetical protein
VASPTRDQSPLPDGVLPVHSLSSRPSRRDLYQRRACFTAMSGRAVSACFRVSTNACPQQQAGRISNCTTAKHSLIGKLTPNKVSNISRLVLPMAAEVASKCGRRKVCITRMRCNVLLQLHSERPGHISPS